MRKKILLFAVLSLVLAGIIPAPAVTPPLPFAVSIAGVSDGTEVGGLFSFSPRLPRGHGLRLLRVSVNGKLIGEAKTGPWFFEYNFLPLANGTKVPVTMEAESPKGDKAAVTVLVVVRNIDFRIIVQVPDSTPQDEGIWIAGNRKELGMKATGEWDPRVVRMIRIGKNLWEKRIRAGVHEVLEYEFTRSSWSTKGKTKSGSVLHPRVRAGAGEARHVVDNWGIETGTSGPKGPVVHFGSASHREVVVFWESAKAEPSRVRYGIAGKPLNLTAGDGVVRTLHEVRLTGLAPDTGYECSAGTAGRTNSFRTALRPGSGAPFTFAALGDFQGGNRITAQVGKEPGLSFLLHTGDMVNHGYSHSEWNQYFGYIRDLAARLPFMTIPGNHEDESPLYGRFHPQPGARYYYTFDYGNTRFFMIDSEREFVPGTKQYAWLAGQLAAAARDPRIRWRVAAFHTPAYSTGKHLSDAAAQKYLVPLFERYGINLVLSGHEHAYQITHPLRAGKRAANGIVYVVSGGAGATLYGFPVKADWIAFRDKLFHYGLYRVFPDRIEHVARDAQGREFHRTVIRK